ncbi:Huntingtin [Eumeta japonica]|uniref:Huntingtin n=1 Tax=Eumeta variegata TaxID=151549 RepID=A0A4C1US25_EUMVA|nr:Huntingtin [Eumeta japonica]
MNVLEKAEKALEFLKHNEGSTKSHELQTAAGTLGRCLGALGSRQNYSRHYVNLLHSAIPTLLSLASNDNAEVRLVGDEALNRAVVGGYAFHAYKTNVILQNQIDSTKNAHALSRICLGECWLRPGVGKIRIQAQTLFPKLAQILRQTNEIQLIVEALENNLPRILKALSEYCIDEEIFDLVKSLFQHVESNDPPVRRGVATCIAHLVAHREILITHVISTVFGSVSAITSIYSMGMLDDGSSQEPSELCFTGALHLGSLSQLPTPMLSVEDLSIQTPDSPASDVHIELHTDILTKDLTEKLAEIQEKECKDEDHVERPSHEPVKINIGSSTDDDIPLKYCARLLASKYMLTGNKGGLIPERTIRVSVKSFGIKLPL